MNDQQQDTTPAQHSLLPWSIEDGELLDGNDLPVGSLYGVADFPCLDDESPEEHDAARELAGNAALVIAAVNSHSRLVAACGEALEWFQEFQADHVHDSYGEDAIDGLIALLQGALPPEETP